MEEVKMQNEKAIEELFNEFDDPILVYDGYTGRFFSADQEELEKIQADLQEYINECANEGERFISLDEFYQEIGIDRPWWKRVYDRMRGWWMK